MHQPEIGGPNPDPDHNIQHTALMQGRGGEVHTGPRRQPSGGLSHAKLVEMFAAAILVAMMLAIIAIAMGFLPSRMG